MGERTEDSALTHLRSLLVADVEREHSAVMEAAALEMRRAREATHRAARAEADRRSEVAERSADTSAPRRRFEEEIEAERIGNELRQRLDRAMHTRIAAQADEHARTEALARELASRRTRRIGAVGTALCVTGAVAVVAVTAAIVAGATRTPSRLVHHAAVVLPIVPNAPVRPVGAGVVVAPTSARGGAHHPDPL